MYLLREEVLGLVHRIVLESPNKYPLAKRIILTMLIIRERSLDSKTYHMEKTLQE